MPNLYFIGLILHYNSSILPFMAKFITFEGCEGSGKTTQSKLLFEYLKSSGMDCIWTREIGGTETAEKIREIIIRNDMDPMTELLLIMAARKEHIDKVILPALAKNITVICDRFIDSSICYQGLYIGADKVLALHRDVFGEFMPDLTFFIDVETEEGLRRASIRGGNNKFEEKDISEHRRIKEGFVELTQMFPQRIMRIDGMRSPEDVMREVRGFI